MTGTSKTIGSLIAGRFKRVAGVGTYGGSVYVRTIGIHYPIDSIGSLNQTTKT